MKLNRTLFNPAIFAYTCWVKFMDWRRWLPLILLLFLPSFSIFIQMTYVHPTLSPDVQKEVVDNMKSFFQFPTVLLLGAYLFVSDGLVSLKVIGDAEPLSLLFTRPVTRFCYIFSRFTGALAGMSILFSLGMSFGLLTALYYGINIQSISLLDYLSIVANAAGFAAFFTFLHCARPLISIVSVITLMGCRGMAGEYSSYGTMDNKILETIKQTAIFLGNCFGDLLPSSQDFAKLLSASYVDYYTLVILLSNIVIFLLLAGLSLSKREFSYGSD